MIVLSLPWEQREQEALVFTIDGIAHYHSLLITYLVSFGVLIFGVNFNLYYFLLLRKFKALFGDEELRTYLIIVASATIFICLNVFHIYQNLSQTLEFHFFKSLILLPQLDLV